MNIIYLHIPKCAGTSIEKALSDHPLNLTTFPNGDVFDNLIRYSALEYGFGSLDLYDVFTTVRNPYTRAVSIWKFSNLKCMQIRHNERQKGNGDSLVAQWAEQRFDRDFTNFCTRFFFQNYDRHLSEYHDLPQCHWLRTSKGDIAPINCFPVEDLSECEKWFNIKIPHENITGTPDASKYYTPEAKRIIDHFFSEDFEMFGYTKDLDCMYDAPVIR